MLFLYAFFVASPSLFNYGSILPIWLLFNIFGVFKSFLKRNQFRIDFFLIYLPLLAALSFVFNYEQSKIGHLVGYFTIFVIVIPSFVQYFSRNFYSLEVSLEKLNKFLSIICWTIFLSSVFDYILLVNFIDYSDFIFSDNNVPVMNIFLSRSRALWNEPTDMCLAANSFFPIFLGTTTYLSNLKKEKKSTFQIKPFFISLMWSVVIILGRSAASIGALLITFTVVFFREIFLRKKHLFLSKNKLFYFLILSTSACFLIFYLGEFFSQIYESVFIKLSLNMGIVSVSDRINGWLELLNYFYRDTNILEFLIGSGPGNNSLMTENNEISGSLSWTLSILSDLGLAGFLVFLYILHKLKIFFEFMPSKLKIYYFISISTLIIHLSTQTGFYLPVLPFVFSLPIIFRVIHVRSLEEAK